MKLYIMELFDTAATIIGIITYFHNYIQYIEFQE